MARLDRQPLATPQEAAMQRAAWRLADRLGLLQGQRGMVAFDRSRLLVYVRGPWDGETPDRFEGIPVRWEQRGGVAVKSLA